jgi:N-acylneuraminate cytidylyltransferase/CMP-N,N'-diacetyllegionaminic acid synthase
MSAGGMTNAPVIIVGVICARGGSKGVRRKNLRPLGGLPLIVYTILCAKACPLLTRLVVSTDDEEISSVAKQWGVEVPFIRPAHLAQDHSSKWEVFRHLVSTLEQQNGQRIDILVDLDTGVPMRTPADIEGCVKLLLSTDADVVTTAYEAERNPYFNMVEMHDGVARIVKQPDTPIASRQVAPKVYSLSPAVFAMKRDILWRVEHWSQAKLRIIVLPRSRAIDIDTEVDFEFVNFLMRKTNPVKV